VRVARIAVIAGPDAGAEFDVDEGGAAIGRAAECAIKLADRTVSRVQARLTVVDGGLALHDAGGPNPIRVNDQPWTGGAIHDGDRIAIGHTVLLLLAPDGGVVPAAQPARTVATLQVGGGAELPALLRELAAAWQQGGEPAALAEAACGAARAATGARRALAVIADASGRLAPIARAPRDAAMTIALADDDLADLTARGAALLDRDGVAIAVASLGAVAGALVAEAPRDPDTLPRLAAIAALLGAQLTTARAHARSERARASLAERAAPSGLIGASPALARLIELVARAAPTTATVLITGESGTGKEKIAEALHAGSGRAAGPLVAINCAALPDTLIESELFGHERGAFTGASERRAGRFEQADGGTLFLDEIGELSEAAQARLLRVLETRRFERVGGARTLAVDVRLIAATHRDLRERVRAGKFREDLYYRIGVVPLHVPPLRERREDIVPLAEHFLARFAAAMGRRGAAFSPAAQAALAAHWWPGNVRELRNVVERAVVLADRSLIELDDLDPLAPPAAPSTAADTASAPAAPPAALHDLERDAVVRALATTRGNKAQAAQLLGIDRTTLYKKLRRFGL